MPIERCPGSNKLPEYVGPRTGKGFCRGCHGYLIIRKDGNLPEHKRKFSRVDTAPEIIRILLGGEKKK